MNDKLSSIYYSPRGYWRGQAAVKKLVTAAKVSEADARSWLKMPVWYENLSGVVSCPENI